MRRLVILISVLAVTAAACAGDTDGTAQPTTTDQPEPVSVVTSVADGPTPAERLRDAQAAWSTHASTYHYTALVDAGQHSADIAWMCGSTGRLEVQVEEGTVTKARDIVNGCNVDLNSPAPFPLTVEGWFQMLTENAAVAEFDVDLQTGAPSSFYVDDGDQFGELTVLEFADGLRPEAGPAERLADLEAARATWERNAADSYTMTVLFSCFCPEEARGPFEITVIDGEPSATFRGEPVGQAAPTHVFTVDGIFDVIEENADAELVDIVYDPESGIPTSVVIDIDFRIADEEIYITVEDFQPPRDWGVLDISLRDGLTELGVDVDAAPDDAVDQGQAIFCGTESLDFSERDGTTGNLPGRRCFVDAHAAGAEAVFVRTFNTIEGDPVANVYRTLPDATLTLWVDATRDNFGSGEWERLECAELFIDRSLGINYFDVDDCS